MLYRGQDCVQVFLEELKEAEVVILESLKKRNKKHNLTPEEKQDYNNADTCWICGEQGLDNSNKKVCLGQEAYCLKCAVDLTDDYEFGCERVKEFKEFKKQTKCKNCDKNKKKYISFSWRQLEFKDSAQFLLASLDKLVRSNKKETFKHTQKGQTNDEFELLIRKGVYPYEYMDSWERFDEAELPPIEKFYSSLSASSISPEDYKHALNVWKTFKCKTLGDYHDLYLKTDVNFRNICLHQYKLDPANYYTSTGLSWDALLKKTNVNLKLLTDYDIHLMIERGLRGGISMVSNRYAKANNPLLEKFYPNEKKKVVISCT